MILSHRMRRATLAVVAVIAALSLAFAVETHRARATAQPVSSPSGALPASDDASDADNDMSSDDAAPTTDATVSALGSQAVPVIGQASAGIGSLTFRSLVPSGWLEAQGAQANDRLIAFAAQQDELLPNDNPQVVQTRTILQKLIPFALKWNDRAKNWHWEVNVIRSPDIDAICLPGGKIVINTAMLDRLGLNEDETALLMGHLIAHALREHARTRIGQEQAAQLASLRAASAAAAASATNAPTGQGHQRALRNVKLPALYGPKGPIASDNVGPQLLDMRYEADDETEADVIGADITSRAGYDPRAGLALWEKVERISHRRPVPPIALAHPVSEKRLKDLKKRQKDMLPLYAKAIGTTVENLPPYRIGKWYPGGVKQRQVASSETRPEKTTEDKPFSFFTKLPHRIFAFFHDRH